MPAAALLVSSVEGHLVERPGTATRGRQPIYIGARRDHDDPTLIVWDTEAVHAISDVELAKNGRAYRRLLAEGALVKRSPRAVEATRKEPVVSDSSAPRRDAAATGTSPAAAPRSRS